MSEVGAIGLAVAFAAGLISFVTLGASATYLGRLLLQYRCEANLLGGAARRRVSQAKQ